MYLCAESDSRQRNGTGNNDNDNTIGTGNEGTIML